MVRASAHELTCVFQPVADIFTGEVLGYEALGRLAGREADGFAPVREWARQHRRQELIFRLLFDRALEMGHSRPPGTLLFVNVTPELAEWLGDRLRADPTSLDGLVLELGEIHFTEAWTGQLAPLRRAGAKLALDDYGTGVQDLSRLVSLKPDWIKVSGEVVRRLARDTYARRVLEGLVYASARSGFGIIVEEVETAETLAELRRLGIRYAQGFLLAPPQRDWLRAVPVPDPPVVLAVSDPAAQAAARVLQLSDRDLRLVAAHQELVQAALDSAWQQVPGWVAQLGLEATDGPHGLSPLLHEMRQHLANDVLEQAGQLAELNDRYDVPLSAFVLVIEQLRHLLDEAVRERGGAELARAVYRLVALDVAVALRTYDHSLEEDPATGLLNRRTFWARGQRGVEAALAAGHPLQFVLVHVEDARRLKEDSGWWPSEEGLAVVGGLLERNAPPTTLLGRVGVLELAALVPEADHARVEEWLTAVRRQLAEVPARPGLSWGLAVLGPDGTTVDALFLRAEADLYRRGRRAAP
jgi:EAL domain-containing protein (putative c-di-GMP-specific phosphodiesterase class I)/GGDEF domain-containing protein